MSVKLIAVKCPECGATLNIEENRAQAFCTYCGAKVMIQNENEKIYRRIDEAKMKQAETDRMIRLKKMELYEQELAEKKKSRKLQMTIAIIMIVLGGLATFCIMELDIFKSKVEDWGPWTMAICAAGILWVILLLEKKDDNNSKKS